MITNKTCLLILGVYRPSNGKLNDAIERSSAEMDKALTTKPGYKHYVDSLKDDEQSTKLEEALPAYDEVRLKLPATRVTQNSQTSIDFIYTHLGENDVYSDSWQQVWW